MVSAVLHTAYLSRLPPTCQRHAQPDAVEQSSLAVLPHLLHLQAIGKAHCLQLDADVEQGSLAVPLRLLHLRPVCS